jgi:hypothetical protein
MVASAAVPCPLPDQAGPQRPHMTAQLDELMQKLRSVEDEIETELTQRREELRFHFENRRIVFEEEVLRPLRAIRIRVSRYLIDANPLNHPVRAGDPFADRPDRAGRFLGYGLSDDLLSDLQHPESAPPRLPDLRPPPSRLSQHHREEQLRLLLLRQRRHCLRARSSTPAACSARTRITRALGISAMQSSIVKG